MSDDQSIDNMAMREQILRLYDAATEAAEFLISKNGEMHPFSFVLHSEAAAPEMFATFTGDEHPTGDQVISDLTAALRQLALKKEIIALSITNEVLIRDPGNPESRHDGVQFKIECVNGDTYGVLAYTSVSSGNLEFIDFVRIPLEPSIYGNL